MSVAEIVMDFKFSHGWNTPFLSGNFRLIPSSNRRGFGFNYFNSQRFLICFIRYFAPFVEGIPIIPARKLMKGRIMSRRTITVCIFIFFVLIIVFLWSERYKPLGVHERTGLYLYDRWTGKVLWIMGDKKFEVEK